MSKASVQESAESLGRSVGAGERSAVDVARAFLAQASRTAPRLGTYLHLEPESIVAAATEIDARRKRGETLGALAGVPVAVKDNICVRGVPLTCGSRILERFRAPYDAHVIGRLRAAGALLYGKTNCDEFAYQPSRNPWDLARVPGGSSGGSAATVAAREAPLALGSDTGGSVRQPAAFCGVVGLKPTYGAVSRYGLVAFASSLDQIGPLATSARDAALLFNAISGPDERDMTSRPETRQVSMENLERGVRGLKIGIARELLGEGLDPEIHACFDSVSKWLVAEGGSVVDVKLPHARYAIATYYLIAPAEASSNLARYDGVRYGLRVPAGDLREMYEATRGRGFGREVKRRILLGTYALSAGYYDAYYLRAQKVRTLIRRDFEDASRETDALLMPVTPTPPFALGEKSEDPMAMYLNDIYSIPASLAGVPALSFPAGFTKGGLPIGLQLTGKPFDEETLLRIARAWESKSDAARRLPPIALEKAA